MNAIIENDQGNLVSYNTETARVRCATDGLTANGHSYSTTLYEKVGKGPEDSFFLFMDGEYNPGYRESAVRNLFPNAEGKRRMASEEAIHFLPLTKKEAKAWVLKNLGAETFEELFGKVIRGFAYPYGAYDDKSVEILKNCGICYARTVNSTRDFRIPQDWLRLPATCHHNDPELMNLADRFINTKNSWSPMLFYLWGHSYEFEQFDNFNNNACIHCAVYL